MVSAVKNNEADIKEVWPGVRWGPVLDRAVRGKLRPESVPDGCLGQDVPGRRKSKCKDPEVREGLECCKNSKGTTIARGE